jgi:hypothetical protein
MKPTFTAYAACAALVGLYLRSMIYHLSGSRNYGQTRQGAYICEKDSAAAGFHPPRITSRTAT